jgi:hypothetical protein
MKYAYIEVQLVGTLENGKYGHSYGISDIIFTSPQEAFKIGEEDLEHDDFIVGEFEYDGKCTAVWINFSEKEGGMKRFSVWSESFGFYVLGVNNELGLLEE